MALLQQVSSEPKEEVKKLVLVLATSMPVIATRDKVVETAEASEDGKRSKDDKYPGNLA